MEYVKCDLCGSEKHEPVARQTDRLHRATEEIFTIVRCVECGLHYTNPRPTLAEIGRYYAAGYAFHADAPGWRRRLDRTLDVLAKSPLAGVEVSAAARAALTTAGIRCWPNLASVPPEERFGLIRMNWSLEHVHSPREYFSFMARHLSGQGQAIITVPNYNGLIYRLAPECVELPVHLYHFRPEDIVAYGEQHGLSVVEVKTFSYPEMFRAAAEVGLLPPMFPARLGIGEAIAIRDFLKPLDELGWGNDMLVVLSKSRRENQAGRDA